MKRTKWIEVLTGILIVLCIVVYYFDDWFKPEIPAAIQQGVKNRAADQPTLYKGNGNRPGQTTTADTAAPPPPPLSLTSLQSEQLPAPAPAPDSDKPTPAVVAKAEPVDKVDKANANRSMPAPSKASPTVMPALPKLEITALNPHQPAKNGGLFSAQSPANSAPATADTLWLQAGSFRDRSNALKRARRMQKQGMRVDVAPAKVNGKTYYRVYVGPIKNGQAARYLKKLSAMQIKARETSR